MLENKEIYDLDNNEIYEMLFGVSLSSCESRKRLYCLRDLLQKLNEEQIENITDKDILDELEQKRIELQKEKYKVQTEKLELNRWIREDARFELFEEKMIDAIKKYSGKLKIPNYIKPRIENKVDPLLCFADCHYGVQFKIKGLQGEIINEYSPDIFEKRMWDLLDETIYILKKENLNHINIINLSDSLDGILRMSQLQSLRLGIVDSIIGFQNFIWNWLNELSNYAIIDYYSTDDGNHNELRPLGSKKGEFPHENTERLITNFLHTVLKDNPNIDIHNNKSTMSYIDINGHKVLAGHGQNDKKLKDSVSYYKMLYNVDVDCFITGHLHHDFSETVGITEEGNIDVIRVPSIVGIDKYTVNIKTAAKPGGKLILFDSDRRKKTTYDIILD